MLNKKGMVSAFKEVASLSTKFLTLCKTFISGFYSSVIQVATE
jgi:hypothetical protein